jgi:hypothetical protein
MGAQDKKLVKKAKRSPQNIRFAELQKIITKIGGYELHNITGDHFTYSKRHHDPITITMAGGGKAKPNEVSDVMKRLKKEGLV